MSANGTRHRRFRAILPAASLMAAVLGSASPARAQFVFDDAILPPRAVAWRLADRGFTPLGRPRFDGRSYVVEAVGPGGARVRVFVDPVDGVIVGRQRLDPPMIAYNRPTAPGYGWTEDEGRVPLPPAEIPGAAIPGAANHGAARTRPESRAPREAYGPATGGIDGLNPERAAKPEAPRRSARLAAPEKARPVVRAVPEAPKPTVPEPAQASPADTSEAPGAAPKSASQAPASPDAPAPAPVERDATWKDPPGDGGRKVRIIGGATVVPGTTDREPGAAR